MSSEPDDKIRFSFISYLITALDRRRKQYIHNMDKLNTFEVPLSSHQEFIDPEFMKLIEDFDNHLPIDQQIENPEIFSSLKNLRADENEVFQWKIMTEYTFKEIAEMLEINESKAKRLYYSALAKMRKKLLVADDND